MYRQRTFCQFFFSSDTRKLTDICAPQRAPRQPHLLPSAHEHLSADALLRPHPRAHTLTRAAAHITG